MEERHTIELVDDAGDAVGSAVFTATTAGGACRLQVAFGEHAFTAEANDFFDALCVLRDELAALGLRPRCYGANRNLVLSGMARDMGAGLQGYLAQPGRAPGPDDLVGIFDVGPGLDPVTVEEQRRWEREWWRRGGSNP